MTTTLQTPPSVRRPEAERGKGEVRGESVPVSGQLRELNLPWRLGSTAQVAGLLFFALFAFLWLVFGALIIANPSALDTVWQHLLDLPTIVQIVAWVLFLPITIGLWIWESDLALWARLALVIVLGAGWTAVMYPRPKESRARVSSDEPGRHEVAHGAAVRDG